MPPPAEYLRLQVCQRHKPLVVVQILRVNQPLTHQIVAEARKRHLRIRQRRRTLEQLAFARIEVQSGKQQMSSVAITSRSISGVVFHCWLGAAGIGDTPEKR